MEEQNVDFTTEEFNLWIPIEKAKSTRPVVDFDGTLRWIQGLASTEDKDLQSEIVEQKGIDFSYALNKGYFNNDHKPGPINKIGEPTEIELKIVENPNNGQKKYGLWVKGFLYNGHRIADEFWELLNAQEQTPGATRRIGFSIQGKVKKRFGNRIQKCWVQDIAITTAPINTETWASVVKSFMVKSKRCLYPNSETCKRCMKDCEFAYSEFQKSLETGYSLQNQTNGNALQVQSLEGKRKQLLLKDENGNISIDDLKTFVKSHDIMPENSVNMFIDMIYLLAEKTSTGGNK